METQIYKSYKAKKEILNRRYFDIDQDKAKKIMEESLINDIVRDILKDKTIRITTCEVDNSISFQLELNIVTDKKTLDEIVTIHNFKSDI